jgi:hypothetical protein
MAAVNRRRTPLARAARLAAEYNGYSPRGRLWGEVGSAPIRSDIIIINAIVPRDMPPPLDIVNDNQ